MAKVKGILLTLDALIATMILVSAAILYSQIYAPQIDTSTSTYGQDLLIVLENIPLNSIPKSPVWKANLYNDTGLNESDSVLYAIGLLVVLNDSRFEELLEIIEPFSQNGTLTKIYVGTELVYQNGSVFAPRNVHANVQYITGIDEGKPVVGTSASAHLKKIRDKSNAAYVYFGGFTGQGNITVQLTLPPDVTGSRISQATLIGDFGGDFDLLINNTFCTSVSPVTDSMRADTINITSCKNSFGADNTSIELQFSDISSAFVAGGYVRVMYTTDTFTTSTSLTNTTYYFPEINGIANVYDSIYIPQTLNKLAARLHYKVDADNTTTYFSIGEKIVYESNNTGDVIVDLDDADFLAAGIDYSFLSNRTVPIRFASFNTSRTQKTNTSNADVVIITDYSGSMQWRLYDNAQGDIGDLSECEEEVYANPNIRRSHLARCLDKEAVKILMNVSGNRIFPVHFYNNQVYSYTNPDDEEAILSYYETESGPFPQNAEGGTGLASALSEAYEIFDTFSNESRTKYVIFMTDGIASNCAFAWSWWPYYEAACEQIDSRWGAQACNGQGTPAQCAVGGSCQPALDNTEIVGQALVDDFNVTIYSIAFGPIESCSSAQIMLQNLASVSNGTYSSSSDVSELQDIYRTISEQIVDSLELVSQAVVIQGNITTNSLYGDSYIRADHDLILEESAQNFIELTRETDSFNSCSPTIAIPSALTVQEGFVTSFSGPSWTDYVGLNDQSMFNLSDYFISYNRLGDPFRISIVPSAIQSSNTFTISTGEGPDNYTGCSDDNTFVYTGRVSSTTARTPVLEYANGCTWTIERDDLLLESASVPSDYVGGNTCSYTNALISYNKSDTYQVAMHLLLEQLDFDSDGRIFASLQGEDLEVVLTEVSGIPYLWGPLEVRVELWT